MANTIPKANRTLKALNAAYKGYKDGSVDFFGDQIEAFSGYARKEFDAKSVVWTEIILEEDRASVRAAFVQALKGDKTYMREYRIRAKGGEILWVQEWGQIVCNEKAEVEYVTGILVDITAQKSAEIARLKSEQRTGKYLTFTLSGQEYGVSILKVKEIIGLMPVRPIPQAPPFVRGVINLRGKVIPVVDLKLIFDMNGMEYTTRTCIIVMEIMGQTTTALMGIIVDSVSEVVHINGGDIEDTPPFISDLDTNYILGMAKMDKSIKVLLDIDRVLSGTQMAGFEASFDLAGSRAAVKSNV